MVGMLVAVTGATGFLGRYIVNHLLRGGHTCRCWHRPSSDLSGFINDGQGIEWIPGRLNDPVATEALVEGVDAVVHSALERPNNTWVPDEKDLLAFAETNVMGSLRLMSQAKATSVERFIFISTCAVHDVILEDRVLDEAHPMWPLSHYGAHKGALEKFVHSFGLPRGWGICSLRPTGIYGLATPIKDSRWYELIRDVVAGKPIDNGRGGKEVHAADVAKAVGILLDAPTETIAGQSYNCYDQYVAMQDVAQIAKAHAGSSSSITTLNKGPKHQIDTTKLRAMGMAFGGRALLEQTVRELVDAIKAQG